MRVKSINYNGFERLYELYNHSRGTGKHLDMILSHVEIDIHIDSLTMIEAFFMRMMFGSGLDDLGASIIDSDDDYNRIFPKTSFPDMEPALKSVVNILPDLVTDKDISRKPGAMILPSGMISREVLLRMSGKMLGLIFDQGFAPVWNTIFITKEGTPIPEKSRPEILDLANEEIKKRLDDICIRRIITELYRTMNESLSSIDREADAYIYDKYYRFMNRNLDCAIAEITTPVGQARFFDNRDVQSQIDLIKKGFSDNSMHRHTFEGDTKITFTVVSSLYTFIELSLALPAGTIVDYSDLNINLASDQILLSRELSKYQTRIVNKMKLFNAIKVELSKSNEFPIGKYNFILLNSLMRYNITVTGEKLIFLQNFLSRVRNGVYGENNTSLYHELDFIVGTIIEISNSMKKVITS